MFRKLMLGMCLATMVFLPGTALASAQAHAPAQAPSQGAGNTVQATETGGGSNFVFQPDTISIKTGDTVTFQNTGKIAHTATADDNSWDSANLDPAKSFTTPAFKTAGTFTYKCTYHVSFGMTGKIVVTGAPTGGSATSASPSASGSASPSPTLTGLAAFGISPAPTPTAPPSQKYFPKIAGAIVVLALLGIVLGYVKTARKLADKG